MAKNFNPQTFTSILVFFLLNFPLSEPSVSEQSKTNVCTFPCLSPPIPVDCPPPPLPPGPPPPLPPGTPPPFPPTPSLSPPSWPPGPPLPPPNPFTPPLPPAPPFPIPWPTAPPPPNPILPYFPWYYKNPPPPPGWSSAMRVEMFSLVIMAPCIAIFSLFF